MEKQIHNRLYEIALKRKGFVSPLILDYHRFRNYGFNDKDITKILGIVNSE